MRTLLCCTWRWRGLQELTAFAMKVVARNRSVFDVSYMNIDQLDDTLILVGIDGKGILLDPGEKMCPFGTAELEAFERRRSSSNPNGAGYETTPLQVYNANVTKRNADITLDEHGAITANIQIIMNGQEALCAGVRRLFVTTTLN